MLKGRCDTSTRKPRLFVESTDAKADGEGDDPIAAALAARKRKQGTKAASSSCHFDVQSDHKPRNLSVWVLESSHTPHACCCLQSKP